MWKKGEFDWVLKDQNKWEALDKILSLEVEEGKIQEFEAFLNQLLDEAIKKVLKFPPAKKGKLDKVNNIGGLKKYNYPFREGQICYLPIKNERYLYVIGDIHGDANAFRAIIEKTEFLDSKTARENITLVFLGDYIDRGLFGLNVLLGILFLKINFPEDIILLKGNHEIWHEQNGEIATTVEGDNMFLDFWKELFSSEIIRKIKKFFDLLPAVLMLSNEIVLVHGGIPRPEIKDGLYSYDYVLRLSKLNDELLIKEMLWSRPDEEKDDVIITYGSPDFSFARQQFKAFMEKLQARIMIRAHDPVLDGYKKYFDGKLITVFSTGGSNNETAYEAYKTINPSLIKLHEEKILVENIFPY
ncbi:MAG: serine/threonine protein phosphatase [Candidatus Saccharicenans sp.]|nr:serine/threonine protein phosphatase [Candidatus Saccharicenans sp.]